MFSRNPLNMNGFLIACLTLAIQANAGSINPADLRCEYLVNPLGIDASQPRLSWRITSADRGSAQIARRILVASDEATLAKNQGDLWDSGTIAASETVNVSYGGKALGSRQACYWKVMVWGKDGRPSEWSAPASWSMGLLQPEDWKAQYISYKDTTPVFKDAGKLFLPPARQYRKEFSTAKAIKRATIYATALGIYELHLNGQRVGDAYFAPGWTDYHQRAYYNTYDVTSLLKQGPNALGAWVGDGWYSGYIGFGLLTGIGTERIGRYTYGKTPSIMAQLEIEYADGSRESVVTDGSWKVTGAGPIQEGDFLMGEVYDARKEMAGWAATGFNDGEWERAIPAGENGPAPATFYEFQNPPPGGKLEVKGHPVDLGFKRPAKLEAFPGVPVRRITEIAPIAMASPTNGVYVFNLGQNFAGVARLKVKGPAGTSIRLRYGEMLHPDGRLMTENLRKARATDTYILRGDPDGEAYIPRFTFHGFQYVEISGYPGTPETNAITGLAQYSDTPMTSEFECSDPIVNRLFKNIVWTQKANFVDLPTDCPQRDERFGWTGDAQAYVRTATYNADAAAFYTKWIRELMESQRPSGTFPGYAPFPFQHGWDFGTAWCDAGIICPWTVYRAYGDTRIIARCWEPMTKFMQWRKTSSKDSLGVVHGNEWGDWLAVNETTPIDYVDTIFYAYDARLMADMATALGKSREAKEYRAQFERTKKAFRKKYVKKDGQLSVDTQTAYALALFVDLMPDNLRNAAGERLADKIRSKAGPDNSGITTGFLGTRPLLPVLTSVGQNDLAVSLLQSRLYPSWGFEVANGATTIWERWNSFTKDKGFGGAQNAEMNSFAHYAFGAVGEWMFSRLAGIDTDGPGFERVIIRPMPPSGAATGNPKPVDWVKARYDCVRGPILSEWRTVGGNFELNTTIPANTRATIYLPAHKGDDLREGGKALRDASGVKFLRWEYGRAVLDVGSGTYQFATATR